MNRRAQKKLQQSTLRAKKVRKKNKTQKISVILRGSNRWQAISSFTSFFVQPGQGHGARSYNKMFLRGCCQGDGEIKAMTKGDRFFFVVLTFQVKGGLVKE